MVSPQATECCLGFKCTVYNYMADTCKSHGRKNHEIVLLSLALLLLVSDFTGQLRWIVQKVIPTVSMIGWCLLMRCIVYPSAFFCSDDSPRCKVMAFSPDGSLFAWCNGQRWKWNVAILILALMTIDYLLTNPSVSQSYQ